MLLGRVEPRAGAIMNLFVGGLQVVTPTFLIFTANGDQDTILLASGLYLFGFTYLYVGIGLLAGLDSTGVGWFSLFVAIAALGYSFMNFTRLADATFGVIWLYWALLWTLFFVLLGLKQEWLTRYTGWVALIEGWVTAAIPGFLLFLRPVGLHAPPRRARRHRRRDGAGPAAHARHDRPTRGGAPADRRPQPPDRPLSPICTRRPAPPHPPVGARGPVLRRSDSECPRSCSRVDQSKSDARPGGARPQPLAPGHPGRRARCRPGSEFRVECREWTDAQIGNNDSANDVRDVDLDRRPHAQRPDRRRGRRAGRPAGRRHPRPRARASRRRSTATRPARAGATPGSSPRTTAAAS